MKIGIVTQPLAANYGGILQNYALQTFLIRMGHEPITIRIGKKTYMDYFKRLIIHIIKLLLARKTVLPEAPYQFKKKQSGMEVFIKNNIKTTPIKRWFESEDIVKYNIESIIVGSDQVWRPNYNAHIEDMFLNFASNFNIPKIVYAASFGVNDWVYNNEQTVACKKLIQQFKSVSVREYSAINLCKNYLDRFDAIWVVDPTMLLNKKDYELLCSFVPKPKDNFLFAYVLDHNKNITDFIYSKAKGLGLKVVLLSAGTNARKKDTVESWLSNFRDASYIITDSFHGTIFSLLFQKKFITIRNISRGNARFDSLISAFNIHNRFVDINSLEFNNEEIDWDFIDNRLDYFRKISMKYLHNSLK